MEETPQYSFLNRVEQAATQPINRTPVQEPSHTWQAAVYACEAYSMDTPQPGKGNPPEENERRSHSSPADEPEVSPLAYELASRIDVPSAESQPTRIARLESIPGYLSVREAANVIGVSRRSVYSYIERGKLPGARVDNHTVVGSNAAQSYERKAPGRQRTRTPPWRASSIQNYQFLIILSARVLPGQSAQLERKLCELRSSQKHRLPGTSARYIMRNEHDPDEVEIVLVWRSTVMPTSEVREAAVEAFCNEFADILDWSTLARKDGRVFLHA